MRNLFAGLASSRFHRPVVPWPEFGTRGLDLSQEAQTINRSVRSFTDAVEWFPGEPHPSLLAMTMAYT